MFICVFCICTWLYFYGIMVWGGDNVAKTNSEIKNAYAKRKYDDIRLQVKKGMKEKIKLHAQSRGFNSLQGYINHLIERDMCQSDFFSSQMVEKRQDTEEKVENEQAVNFEEVAPNTNKQ